MESILKALFNGKINPSARNSVKDSEHQLLTKKIDEERAYFKDMLSPESYKRLEELENLYLSSSDMEDYAAFSYGFRLAVLLMVDVFASKSELE